MRQDRQRSQRKQVEELLTDCDAYDDDDYDPDIVGHISESSKARIYISDKVFGTPVKFHLETGSSVSLMNKTTFTQWFASDAYVVASPATLLNYSRQPIQILGAFKAMVTFRERHAQLLFYIADRGTSLLGMDAVVALDIQMSGATRSCFYIETADTDEASASLSEQSPPLSSHTLTPKSTALQSATTPKLDDSSMAVEEE